MGFPKLNGRLQQRRPVCQVTPNPALGRELPSIDEPLSQLGRKLFFSKSLGGADCASCHSGDFFTDEDFRSICAPQLGRGKGYGFLGTNDHRRARENDDRNYRFSFRTSSLLNVSATGPYLHAGIYDDLADDVDGHLLVEIDRDRNPL